MRTTAHPTPRPDPAATPEGEEPTMRYTVAYAEYLTSFEEEVNKLLDRGWRPQGGVFQARGVFYQALIRTDATEEPQA
jgi:hypothetical protein